MSVAGGAANAAGGAGAGAANQEHLTDIDVFLSHAGEDRTAAVRLRQALLDGGLRPWVSFVDIPLGAPYPEEIVRAIDRCRTLVLLVSRASTRSEHVYREVVQAASAQKRIMPLYIETDVPIPAGLRYYLHSLHRMRFAKDDIEKAGPLIAACVRDRSVWLREATPPSLLDRLTASPIRSWSSGVSLALVAGLIVWGLQATWHSHGAAREVARLDSLAESFALLEVISAERSPGNPASPWLLRMNLVLVASDARFSSLKLLAHSRDSEGESGEVIDLSGSLDHSQVGGGQMLSVRLPRLGRHLTLCLGLPHPRTGQRWHLVVPFGGVTTAAAGVERVTFRPTGVPVALPGDQARCP